ncbi:MAG: hypothetical protein CM1200mP29_11640 [Verrucomicrobiota bacterium]|nr:MAG: hypothetical protein CM1200mP29_11640 [Verrucomicrobiota bacterium]
MIRAFNDNLPYDDFLTWQLAGDLLPSPTDDQRLATTFNRLHPQKVEGGSVPEEFRVEYVADRNQLSAQRCSASRSSAPAATIINTIPFRRGSTTSFSLFQHHRRRARAVLVLYAVDPDAHAVNEQ